MAPLITLLTATVCARLLGLLGIDYVDTWPRSAAVGLAAMFLLTGLSRLSRERREGLIAIVPPALPRPGALVAITGVLEAVGGIAVLVPASRVAAAVCLGILLIAMFPANVRAAGERRSPTSPNTPLGRRAAMQIVFLVAVVVVAVGA